MDLIDKYIGEGKKGKADYKKALVEDTDVAFDWVNDEGSNDIGWKKLYKQIRKIIPNKQIYSIAPSGETGNLSYKEAKAIYDTFKPVKTIFDEYNYLFEIVKNKEGVKGIRFKDTTYSSRSGISFIAIGK